MLSSNRRILILSSLVLVSVAYSTSLAGRCTPRTLQENFDFYDVVFSGTVEVAKEAPEEYGQTFESGDESGEEWLIPAIEVRLKVDEIWKGNAEDHITLYTTDTSPSPSRPYIHPSGYPFETSSKYLVFARYSKSQIQEDQEDAESNKESELHLRTGWCAGNMVLGANFRGRPFLIDVTSEDGLLSQLSEFKSKSDETDENDSEETDLKDEKAHPP